MSRYSKQLYVGVIVFLFLPWILQNLSEQAWAHGPLTRKGHIEQVKSGPHGGLTNRFGINYVEIVVDPEKSSIKIYFFDKEMRPITVPEEHSASGYLSTLDGSIVWITFNSCGIEAGSCLEADTGLSEPDSFKAVISIKNSDKRDNFRFRWVSTSEADEADENRSEVQ